MIWYADPVSLEARRFLPANGEEVVRSGVVWKRLDDELLQRFAGHLEQKLSTECDTDRLSDEILFFYRLRELHGQAVAD